MLNIIFYVFVVIVALQLFYYLIIFGKFAFAKLQTSNPKKIPVSVIVCAKNDAENIKSLVPLLAKQNYPDFEIVLVNNASSDNTLEIFEEFEKQYSNIKIVDVENNEAFWGNKKFALTLGIKAAKKEYLLFTNADCYPTSENWITQMSSQFTLSKTIVLGYSTYEKVKNSFLNKIIRFDTMLGATQYFSWAKTGAPYTGTGKNLAYKKEDFFRVNGFINHMNIRTGEDELFINQAANKKNTTICYTKESFTITKAKTTFTEWLSVKKSNSFTAKHYKASDKFQLQLFYTSQLLFIVLATLLLAFQYNWILIVPIIAFRYLVTWLCLGYSANKLYEKDVMYWYPIIEIILIFTQLNILFTSMFSKSFNWK